MSMFGAPAATVRHWADFGDDGKPVLKEEEELYQEFDSVQLAFPGQEEGEGRLFLTTKRVIWQSADGSKTYDFDVPYIALHAVSNDAENYSSPCLYCQFVEEREDVPQEMYLVPSSSEQLVPFFQAFSHVAMLNPDPPEDGEEEGDDELIFNAEEVMLGAEQERMLQHWESVFHVSDNTEDGQFDDADGDGEEEDKDDDQPPMEEH